MAEASACSLAAHRGAEREPGNGPFRPGSHIGKYRGNRRERRVCPAGEPVLYALREIRKELPVEAGRYRLIWTPFARGLQAGYVLKLGE